MMQVYCIIA